MGKPLFGAQLGAYWEDRYNVEFSKRDLNFDLEQKHGDRCIDFMIDNEDGVHQIIVEVTAESHISDRKFDQVAVPVNRPENAAVPCPYKRPSPAADGSI